MSPCFSCTPTYLIWTRNTLQLARHTRKRVLRTVFPRSRNERNVQGGGGRGVQIGGSVDLSTLAHVSEGYTAGSIYRSVKTTLTPRRVHRIAKRPLLSSEFLGVLAQQQQLLKKNVQARLGAISYAISLEVEIEREGVEGDGQWGSFSLQCAHNVYGALISRVLNELL